MQAGWKVAHSRKVGPRSSRSAVGSLDAFAVAVHSAAAARAVHGQATRDTLLGRTYSARLASLVAFRRCRPVAVHGQASRDPLLGRTYSARLASLVAFRRCRPLCGHAAARLPSGSEWCMRQGRAEEKSSRRSAPRARSPQPVESGNPDGGEVPTEPPDGTPRARDRVTDSPSVALSPLASRFSPLASRLSPLVSSGTPPGPAARRPAAGAGARAP